MIHTVTPPLHENIWHGGENMYLTMNRSARQTVGLRCTVYLTGAQAVLCVTVRVTTL